MISDLTLAQLETLAFTGRPLVICDVDEVVVHFTRDFEDYLAAQDLLLDTSSFALNGNVRCRRTGAPAPDEHVARLISSFFDERTRHMQPIDGAVDSLLTIGETADVVLLTNLPHTAGDHRRANLAGHGLPFPVVTNSGPKGPAIRDILRRARQPAVFIDDSPSYIASCFEHAPEVHLVHFLHDERFARHVEPLGFVSLRTASWDEARPHILELIRG
ncbi:hypothetical protein [Aestuariivirga sp.]|uniref:hypothetical protein n=1 Tax=Aestuariivirga sp. TaxID=2650926 RepID=UPI00391DC38B